MSCSDHFFKSSTLSKLRYRVYHHLKNNNPRVVASSALGTNDVYVKFKEFKSRLQPGASRELYFVKVDVKACFDTIQQEKLLDVINSVLTEVSLC